MVPIKRRWIGGEHDFALPIGQLRALQSILNSGPEEILARLRVGSWRVDDLIQTIRHGLIGGGMDELEATTLVRSMVEIHPLISEFKILSAVILQNALFGPEDDKVGKPEGVETPPESGSSQNATEAVES